MTDPPSWREAEAAHTDDVVGDDSLGELFAASAARNAETDAQLYQGGVYDRSLTGSIIPEAPDGKYAAISYEQMADLVERLAAGFRDLGVVEDTRVGIFSSTRMEWALSDFALLSAGGVVTTVYTESGPETLTYLLDDPNAEAVVVENRELLDRILEAEDELDLSFIVVMDDEAPDREDIYTLAEVYDRGTDAFEESAYRSWLADREPDDLASIIYTSGTTGMPKGVPLTHGNFRANINQTRKRLGPRPDKHPDEPTINAGTTSISFLPLAHVFERTAGHFFMFGSGATVGYVASPETLSEDITKIQPNAGLSVPRVYERIFGKMRQEASGSAVTERIFEWSIGVAREYGNTADPGAVLRLKHGVADKLVFSTLREKLGDNIQFMVSGGGSLSKSLCETFLGMGIPIVEGYGLTETAPVVSINPPADIRPGTLGVPVDRLDVRIDTGVVDDPEFDGNGELGELLVAGPNVVDGYWNDPGATERAFTELGGRRWFRTGDIVERRDDDFLIYHDRLKQLIVLSTGKNVAPQPIEDRFATSDRIEQIMVVGDEQKFVAAIVVPDFEQLERWAESEGIDIPADPDARCADNRVHQWVQEDIDDVNAKLDRIQRIKKFTLVPQEWTEDNDLLTPSMKKKRHNIRTAFESKLEELYGEDAVRQ